MFQKVIVILKNGSKKEVLKLAESNGTIKVTLGDNIKYPSTLLIDCGMEFELNLSSGISEFSGSIADDVSAVLLTDGEVFSGTNGKKDKCYSLLSSYDNRQKSKSSDSKNGGVENRDLIDNGESFDSINARAAERNETASENAEGRNERLSESDTNDIIERECVDACSKTDCKVLDGEHAEYNNGEIGVLSKDKKSDTTDCDEKKTNKGSVNSDDKKEATVFFGGIEFSGNNFYQAVKSQLDEMFVCYPIESRLTERLPNSKWIRVDCEDEYYVVGLIYELDEVIYVCYGIPGTDKVLPPDEISDVAQYVDIDEDGGVWMIFQDAKTGKCISRNDVVKI